MLLVISPAKNLDYETAAATKTATQPTMLDQAQQLIEQLRPLAPHDVSALMKLSDKLGQLNYDRFQDWSQPFTSDNAKQAVLAFNGDVYTGLDANSFSAVDFKFAQQHLRILSGLYGLLRPLDLMQAYRLEMGTKFQNEGGKNLYEFWGDRITEALNQQLAERRTQTLVNLASNEYFKSVKPKQLKADIITPVFKDWKMDKYKIISFYAKKARGLMARYIIQNQLTEPEQLKGFDLAGYGYSAELSTSQEIVFTRRLDV
jgi:cytoplasmic iron level regulating protein YaaA (DUF328/UPF0246 family)